MRKGKEEEMNALKRDLARQHRQDDARTLYQCLLVAKSRLFAKEGPDYNWQDIDLFAVVPRLEKKFRYPSLTNPCFLAQQG